MIATLKKYKFLIIIVVVVVLVFFIYGEFFKGNSSSSAALTQTTTTTTNADGTTATDTDGPEQQFVTQLLAIQNIKFNTSIFSDPAYTYLQDFSKALVPQEVGRPNPFAPIGSDSGIFTQTGIPASTTLSNPNSPDFTNTSDASSTKAGTGK